jgi:hypothetical protein
MKRIAHVMLVACLILSLAVTVFARPKKTPGLRPMRPVSDNEFEVVDPLQDYQATRGRFTSAQVDTYCIVWYDFEEMNWQGWTRVDNTEQLDTFTHVDDFSGISPGEWGGLVPIEGTKSMWCGARDWDHQIPEGPGDYMYLCSWASAPGYGNGWDQELVTEPIQFSGLLTFSYKGHFDTEPDYDSTLVEYDAGGGDWIEIVMYEDVVDTLAVHELLLAQAATKLRFHFTSDDAWSDEDGLWDTDGAFIVDSITIADIGGTIDYEDFEDWPLGAVSRPGALWHAGVGMPFGKYSGLLAGIYQDKDPCHDNLSTQIVFFIGGPHPNPSKDYPGLYDTPFCLGPGGIEAPCQDEYVMSSIIDMTKYSTARNENQDADIPPAVIDDLGGVYLRFTYYADLPIPNLVFYDWAVRNIDSDGCPGMWSTRYIYYYSPFGYVFDAHEISDLVESDSIQVKLGCIDMCDVWYEVYGNCENHTPSPWYDNVRVQRYYARGPQWYYRCMDLFQDNFPGDEFDLESYIRADCANDLRPNDDPVIDPGDSAAVTCTSPMGGGIDTTADGWPKVYLHVYPEYIGDPGSPKPTLYGPSLEGTYGRYDSDDGSTWTILQCGYARTGAGNISPDKYAVDLNDSLFTRGYRVNFYFTAYDFDGETSTLPQHAEEGEYFEWTCLPTLASDILYVDDFHGRGHLIGMTEIYWNPSFRAVIPPDNQPDRYDVNSPSSGVSNGPGSRAKNNHLTTAYHKIIWDSGNLDWATITDGTEDSDKSNDAQMLVDWMEYSPHDVGVWVCGNNIAWELSVSSAPVAAQLMENYCGVQLVDDDYYDITGYALMPKVTAVADPGNSLWHTTWGDSFSLFGSSYPCYLGFDVLEKTVNGQYAFRYPDHEGSPYYAGIYSTGINDGGYDIRTMWFGFSFMYIRDCELGEPIMRNQIVRDVIDWFTNDTNIDITEVDEVPAVNSLAQNYPNPFNPTTTIEFSLEKKGAARLEIYNVAGQLVRTLVDGVKDAGPHRIVWDGRNNEGIKVASGIYLYRIETVDFAATRKMALLR